jgi:HSP20 family protein
MSPDTTNPQREGSSAQQKSSPDVSQASTTRSGRADRERAIQTERERGRSTSMATRPATAPVYGSRWDANPVSVMRRMADNLDRLFEDFGFPRTTFGIAPFLGAELGDDPWRDESALGTAWTPQVETFRRGDKLVVRADLPGLRKEDVNVEVDAGTVMISGERREEHEEDREGYYRSERSYGRFFRAIPLPEGVNAEQCEASFKDGVLEVTLHAPKEAERKSKRIQIR